MSLSQQKAFVEAYNLELDIGNNTLSFPKRQNAHDSIQSYFENENLLENIRLIQNRQLKLPPCLDIYQASAIIAHMAERSKPMPYIHYDRNGYKRTDQQRIFQLNMAARKKSHGPESKRLGNLILRQIIESSNHLNLKVCHLLQMSEVCDADTLQLIYHVKGNEYLQALTNTTFQNTLEIDLSCTNMQRAQTRNSVTSKVTTLSIRSMPNKPHVPVAVKTPISGRPTYRILKIFNTLWCYMSLHDRLMTWQALKTTFFQPQLQQLKNIETDTVTNWKMELTSCNMTSSLTNRLRLYDPIVQPTLYKPVFLLFKILTTDPEQVERACESMQTNYNKYQKACGCLTPPYLNARDACLRISCLTSLVTVPVSAILSLERMQPFYQNFQLSLPISAILQQWERRAFYPTIVRHKLSKNLLNHLASGSQAALNAVSISTITEALSESLADKWYAKKWASDLHRIFTRHHNPNMQAHKVKNIRHHINSSFFHGLACFHFQKEFRPNDVAITKIITHLTLKRQQQIHISS